MGKESWWLLLICLKKGGCAECFDFSWQVVLALGSSGIQKYSVNWYIYGNMKTKAQTKHACTQLSLNKTLNGLRLMAVLLCACKCGICVSFVLCCKLFWLGSGGWLITLKPHTHLHFEVVLWLDCCFFLYACRLTLGNSSETVLALYFLCFQPLINLHGSVFQDCNKLRW